MLEVGNSDTKIPNLSAPIVPGRSSAGIAIGSRMEDLLAQSQPSRTERRSEYVVYDFESVKVWSLNGLVTQIGAYKGYRGTLDKKIGIGSSIADVEDCCRCKVVEDDEDNLVALGSRGWSFETTEWIGDGTIGRNRNASIVAIFVHKF